MVATLVNRLDGILLEVVGYVAVPVEHVHYLECVAFIAKKKFTKTLKVNLRMSGQRSGHALSSVPGTNASLLYSRIVAKSWRADAR